MTCGTHKIYNIVQHWRKIYAGVIKHKEVGPISETDEITRNRNSEILLYVVYLSSNLIAFQLNKLKYKDPPKSIRTNINSC